MSDPEWRVDLESNCILMHVWSCDVLCEVGIIVEWGNLKQCNIHESRKLETLQNPKIEPHRLQLNLKYQIWTCMKLLRWIETPIWLEWPPEKAERIRQPTGPDLGRSWRTKLTWVHLKLEMKLILNWECFDAQLSKTWIWSECDLKSDLNLKWLWFEFEMIVIWIWNDCELNWAWIEVKVNLSLGWIWIKFEVPDCENWAPSHCVHILTTECILISLLHAYRLNKSLQ